MRAERLIKEFVYSIEETKREVHFHNDYQIIFVMSGAIEVAFDNGTFVADQGSLVFISNLENHSFSVLTKPCEKYFITLGVHALDEAIMDSQLLAVFKNRPGTFCNVFKIEPIVEEVTKLFQLMYAEVSRTQNEYSERYIQHIMNLIMMSVYRNNSQQFPILRKSSKLQIYDVQKHLDQHFNESLSLQDICRDFHISPSYLSRCFKEVTGYSPKQYIMLHRMSYAHNLILTTDHSILEIAHKSGFGDINNFIRHFRSQYKMTPTHARKHRTS